MEYTSKKSIKRRKRPKVSMPPSSSDKNLVRSLSEKPEFELLWLGRGRTIGTPEGL